MGCAVFAALGMAALAYLHGEGLTSPSKYHTDLTQSPHWVAYHGNVFAADDLLVEYSSFNESPVQNAIYWLGTWFVDVVLLNKLVGIAVFGATAALFFALVSTTAGPLAGTLAALFFIVFPRSTYEIAGGFSKAWAIGFVLIAVHVVETRRWRLLPWVMPVAALAYPVSPVLIGAVVAVGIALELPRGLRPAVQGLTWLGAGSGLALLPLLYKYFTPPSRIGEMISAARMREMWETGESTSVTVPLWEELFGYFEHAFFVYGIVALLVVLGGRGLVWKRSWSALVIASAVSYYVADFVVPRLYLPDRYTRFSIAVLLVLWFAHNGARALERLEPGWLRHVAVAAAVVLAAFSFDETFRPCEGDESQGIWEDKSTFEGLSAAIAAEPLPVLVAGYPNFTAETMIQARRPVLVIHRMVHAWFAGYREAMDARIKDTFRALYARDKPTVNRLAERYGVTHLIVRKRHYQRVFLRDKLIYKRPYHEFAEELVAGEGRFVLSPPPKESVIFRDRKFWLVRLPLE